METLIRPPWWDVNYTTRNDGYKNSAISGPKGLVLHSTASPGVDANGLQANFNAPGLGKSVHGAIDDKHFVQFLPFEIKAGHVGSGDKGSFNNTHLGIEICEPKGIKYNGNASAILEYSPPAGYFAAVRDKAVWLFAWLCREYGIDPLRHDEGGGVVGHYEAYALGYGSNHGDPRHWWADCENYTMDKFRRAVFDLLEYGKEDDMARYNVISDMPAWAQLTIRKLCGKKLLNGSGTAQDKNGYPADLDLSEDMLRMFVVNDRAGVYGD